MKTVPNICKLNLHIRCNVRRTLLYLSENYNIRVYYIKDSQITVSYICKIVNQLTAYFLCLFIKHGDRYIPQVKLRISYILTNIKYWIEILLARKINNKSILVIQLSCKTNWCIWSTSTNVLYYEYIWTNNSKSTMKWSIDKSICNVVVIVS